MGGARNRDRFTDIQNLVVPKLLGTSQRLIPRENHLSINVGLLRREKKKKKRKKGKRSEKRESSKLPREEKGTWKDRKR